VGAGVSEVSGPDHSTTDPSEYVWRTANVYVFAASVRARNENAASSPVGTRPPSHVTLVTTELSPEPDWATLRFQPGLGTNESIVNPDGGVSSIFVVVASAFSVGTASVKIWLVFAATTGGLTSACANADAQKTHEPKTQSKSAAERFT
jgi:hypothetical protein